MAHSCALRSRVATLCVIACVWISSASVTADDRTVEFSGETMGTVYVVKIHDPPEFDVDVRFEVDAALRRVNDQMSTYLKTSEIGRFNDSDSTQWFEVSRETAEVVEFAQEVASKTDGAFDITVAPLVNAWSFGVAERTKQVPDPKRLEEIKAYVGYEKLSVRVDPPALRKSHPELQVDLSGIAKGYGADRVVDVLSEHGAANVFVEIGGEVRTSGSKSGQWWKVGIQLPDAARNTVMIAHSLSTGGGDDQAMATSGDYRNFFEADGTRYSHTIDPRTGLPVTHDLASVSVVSDSCMKADAWATAINVLGPNAGLEAARREGLHALLIQRKNDGEFELLGTGTLVQYATQERAVQPDRADAAAGAPFAVMAITFIAFAVVLFAMAVGVMFGRRSISGSCGGLANSRNEDGSVSCSLCSNPADACKELRHRMEAGTRT